MAWQRNMTPHGQAYLSTKHRSSSSLLHEDPQPEHFTFPRKSSAAARQVIVKLAAWLPRNVSWMIPTDGRPKPLRVFDPIDIAPKREEKTPPTEIVYVEVLFSRRCPAAITNYWDVGCIGHTTRPDVSGLIKLSYQAERDVRARPMKIDVQFSCRFARHAAKWRDRQRRRPV